MVSRVFTRMGTVLGESVPRGLSFGGIHPPNPPSLLDNKFERTDSVMHMREPASSDIPSRVDESIPATHLSLINIPPDRSLAPPLAPPLTPPAQEPQEALVILAPEPPPQPQKFPLPINRSLALLVLGGLVGSAVTLPFLGQSSTPTTASLELAQVPGELLYGLYVMDRAIGKEDMAVKMATSGSGLKPSALSAVPQTERPTPLFVDRFYIPAPGAGDASENNAPMMVVDRFYFSQPPGSGPARSAQGTAASPEEIAHLSFLEQYYPAGQLPGPANLAWQGPGAYPGGTVIVSDRLPVPVPPPTAAPGTVLVATEVPVLSTGTPPPQPVAPLPSYTLLGVFVTQGLSAALFQTEHNTYSVRLGETVGNSQWVLRSVQRDKAVLNKGNQTLTLSVGDMF